MSIDLKPCPFCGGSPKFIDAVGKASPPFYVVCTTEGCFCKLWPSHSKEEAIELWNTRHEPAKVSEQPDYSEVKTTDGLGNAGTICFAKSDQPDEWRDTHIKKLNKRSNSLRSIALELVGHIRIAKTLDDLKVWADDSEKRVWEAEGLNDE